MPKLYSYCLRVDDGAAPNPFWGVCTLVICKPAIRRTAEVGDWIVGTGSTNSPLKEKDISKYVVYAMQVTCKMTMKEYDDYTKRSLPNKIPAYNTGDWHSKLGDSIYDFSVSDPPTQRRGVHTEDNIKTDRSGEYALLSTHFYYFGDRPERLPECLEPIAHPQQGHKVTLNQLYLEPFERWIERFKAELNTLRGEPQIKDLMSPDHIHSSCADDCANDTDEEFMGNEAASNS